jgi:hypothetical protein
MRWSITAECELCGITMTEPREEEQRLAVNVLSHVMSHV